MKSFVFALGILFLICSCQTSISPENLYGEWKYTQVENPKNPEESLSEAEVALQHPSIKFSSDSSLIIMWGGSQLSKGKFRIEGKLIRYKEELADGKIREFPFLISRLTDSELVFETMEQLPIRVTARKSKAFK